MDDFRFKPRLDYVNKSVVQEQHHLAVIIVSSSSFVFMDIWLI